MMKHSRTSGRAFDELRPLEISYGMYGYAPGSVLISFGKTKVLCAVTLEQGVPAFLRGKGSGWLSAEYAMLPTATINRTQRESSVGTRNGRSVEISRLIGRVLRTVIDTTVLGERTIFIDCDVLQADGGTRSASITGAYAALVMAQSYWLSERIIKEAFLIDHVASVSIGILQSPVLDPDYLEDSAGNGDFNVVMTKRGSLIEIQGGAEKKPLPQEVFDQVYTLAKKGIMEIFTFLEKQQQAKDFCIESNELFNKEKKSSLFSLQNRFTHIR